MFHAAQEAIGNLLMLCVLVAVLALTFCVFAGSVWMIRWGFDVLQFAVRP